MFAKSVMNLRVKLQNMELWIMDYKQKDHERAQILQLKFVADLTYNKNNFYSILKCSQKNPLKKMKSFQYYSKNTKSFTLTSINDFHNPSGE